MKEKYKVDFGTGEPKEVAKWLKKQGYKALAKCLFRAIKKSKSNQ